MRSRKCSIAGLVLLGLVGCATTVGSSKAETPNSAGIIAALLSQSAMDLQTQAECSGDGFEGYSADAPWTLGDDIASVLAELTDGANSVTAECWPPENGSNTCTVTFGQDKGELVWSRSYRFQMVGGKMSGDLMCISIP